MSASDGGDKQKDMGTSQPGYPPWIPSDLTGLPSRLMKGLGSTGEVCEEGGFYSYLWLKSPTHRLTT